MKIYLTGFPILIVTDEIENEKSEGEFFSQLFYKYHRDVYPAKIVFVSFLENPLGNAFPLTPI